MMNRRDAIIRLGAVAGAALFLPNVSGRQAKIAVVVYKDPNCGCCSKWVEHLQANGFMASVKETTDIEPIKTKYHVGPDLRSCHTAVVGGYVIEGHVPAADIKKLLATKPAGTIGLTIPGMPASAPGMDGKPFVAYTVLSFDVKGTTAVFAEHKA